MIANIVQDVVDDLGSRQALAGAASGLYVAAFIVGWWWWTRRIRRRRQSVDVAVLVTGSRGKSSTVRALHAAFTESGRPCYAKTTGTAAAELSTDGTERPTRRLGQVSILEVLRVMDKALEAHPQPQVLAFECMAVRPNLIAQIADEMLSPNVVVITNVRIDHLEDEGSSLEEITASMAAAITPGSLVVTGESRRGPLEILRQIADEHDAQLVVASPDDVAPDISARLPDVHPQNLTFVLAITRALGIDDDVAVTGVAQASKEPGEREIRRRAIDGVDVFYTDLGAINDPVSLAAAMESFPWPLPRDVPRVGIVTGRWDRPLRDLSFVGCLDRQRFDALVLAGGPVHQMRRRLWARGWPRDRIVIAGPSIRWGRGVGHRVSRLLSRIVPDSERVMLIGLENEHDPVADEIRSFFDAGEHVPLTPGSGAR